MSLDLGVLRAAAYEVVVKVVKDGKLHEFTQGLYRKKVEQTLSLEPGTLDAPEYKKVVRNVANDYITKHEEIEQEHQDGDVEEAVEQAKPSGAARERAQPSKAQKQDAEAKPLSMKKLSKGKKPARSSEAISGTETKSWGSRPKSRATALAQTKRVDSESEVGSNGNQSDGPPSKRPKVAPDSPRHAEAGTAPAASSPPAPAGLAQGSNSCTTEDPKSESEMSVLLDGPPTRKRKKTESRAPQGSKAKKGRKPKETGKELSKDEETVKRLKSLVVACGVRKVWSKEFKDLEKPADQIRRLRQMLTDLGMTGRMSLEQAKAIRAKREFDKELEDVQEFANKMAPSSSTRRDSDSEVDIIPKRPTARQSIMAFLGDESD
ncbi:hypothetical protein BD413DRAFT_156501 [Trametes elegans]|nr:hypothetical protein BD413DRAFT_156501 [Trametes elegans]